MSMSDEDIAAREELGEVLEAILEAIRYNNPETAQHSIDRFVELTDELRAEWNEEMDR